MNSTTSNPLIEAIEHVLFPSIDIALRSGKHISNNLLAEYLFLNEHFPTLSLFYQRYHVQLLHAPEGYFYLRPQINSLMSRSLLSPLEMLVGKVLCLMYLDPNRLTNDNTFTLDQLLAQLFSLLDPVKLMQLAHPRAQGSDLDKQRLVDKLKSCLWKLRKMGMLVLRKVEQADNRPLRLDQGFSITEAIFRFAAELRTDRSPEDAQRQFILDGEACWLEPEANQEFDPNGMTEQELESAE